MEHDEMWVVPPRRSGARRGAVAGGIVVVVGLVVALPLLKSGASSAGQGDWPGQFTRCGESAPAGPGTVEVTLADAPAQIGVHDPWTAAVTASSSGQGWVYGTDLSLVRDGVVVAVQDGPQVPLPEQVPEWGGDYPVATFPLVTDVSLALASCDQYPDGQGSLDVDPGTYDLVVSQTLGLLPDGGTVTGAWGVATTTVTVVADGGPAAQDPMACGASTAGLAALASQESNPAPLRLEVLPDLVVRATNTGTTALAATTGHPTVVIARDGVIVGGLDAHEDIGLPADLAVGGHADYEAKTNAFDCATVGVGEYADSGEGDPLPAGEYEVWAVMTFFGDTLTPTQDDRPGTVVAGGPEPFTID